MKRISLLLLSILLILPLLASACSNKKPGDTDKNTEGTTVIAENHLPDTPDDPDPLPSDGVYVQYAVNSKAAGSISGNTLQNVGRSKSTQVTATANLGYRFVRWSDGVTTPTRSGDKPESSVTITAVFDYDTLEMPILAISTETGRDVESKTEYIGASLTIFNADKDYALNNFDMKIRGRGNNTWTYEKKSYKMKLSEKQSLLGLGEGKAKKWVLLANHCDQSLLRNYVSLHLAASMPSIAWSPDCTSVEVYLNGEYRGVYLLAEEIDVNPNKVALSEDVNGKGEDIGYLIEMTNNGKDVTFEAGNKTYQIHNDLSENDDEWYTQYSYIRNYVQDCWDALRGGDESEISKLIDIDSMVDSYLVEEMVKNLDVGWDSFYLYKDGTKGKLTFGPLWDFDLALGNANEGCEYFDALYAAYNEKGQSNPWFYTAMNYKWFRERVLARWEEIADKRDGLSAMVTENAKAYYKSYCRNFEKWQIFGQSLNRETYQITSLSSYKEHYEFLASWIQSRLDWLDVCFHEESFLTDWNGQAPDRPGWDDGPWHGGDPGINGEIGNDAAEELLENHKQLTVDRGSVDTTKPGFPNEEIGNLFDNNIRTKYCADIGDAWWWWWEDTDNTVDITFSLTEGAKLSGYIFRTANDTSMFPERNPEEWVLYGKDASGNWVEIDSCDSYTMGMAAADFCSFGRMCQTDTAYTEYKLTITHWGTLQLSEFMLFTEEN